MREKKANRKSNKIRKLNGTHTHEIKARICTRLFFSALNLFILYGIWFDCFPISNALKLIFWIYLHVNLMRCSHIKLIWCVWVGVVHYWFTWAIRSALELASIFKHTTHTIFSDGTHNLYYVSLFLLLYD